MSIRVIVAEDHTVVREGLKAFLEREGFRVVGEAANGREAVRLASELHPDVAVVDIAMPILNGLEAARELQQLSPKVRVVLLTMYDEDQYVIAALRAGIRGYVLKTQAGTDLVQAIRQVSRNEVYLSPGVSRVVIEAYLSKSELPADPLSPRERQVLQLIGEGKSSKEIAVLLGISLKTAESHRHRLMQKLEIHETATLVRYAIRRGLIQA